MADSESPCVMTCDRMLTWKARLVFQPWIPAGIGQRDRRTMCLGDWSRPGSWDSQRLTELMDSSLPKRWDAPTRNKWHRDRRQRPETPERSLPPARIRARLWRNDHLLFQGRLV